MTTLALPHAIDEVTPQWLTQALRERCPGITVARAEVQHVIWGTSTKVLMRIEQHGADCGIPERICVKGELDERVRQSLAGLAMTGTQVEASFYNDLAPRLGVPLPRHWYGGAEPGLGILILDDLAALGTTFGTPTRPWSIDEVGKGLDILAILHASTWGKRFPELGWLKVGFSPAIRQYTELLMSAEHWQSHFTKLEVFKLPAALADRERSLKALRAMWAYDDEHPCCLIHGDAHLGNTCIDAAGQPYFIDWAGPSISHWALDVSYFIAGSLSVADRRAAERDLFNHYQQHLQQHGGPVLDAGASWDDYRRHMMHGLGWTTLPPTMQSVENVQAIGERYTAAIIDHDSLRMLGA